MTSVLRTILLYIMESEYYCNDGLAKVGWSEKMMLPQSNTADGLKDMMLLQSNTAIV